MVTTTLSKLANIEYCILRILIMTLNPNPNPNLGSDFCVNYKGVDLCYEGSPSWQAYGTSTWPRRARVTELRDFGSTVMSWKRLDESTGEGQIVDFSTLWSQSASTSTEYSEKANVKKFVHATNRRTISAEVLNSLPRREQKHRRG